MLARDQGTPDAALFFANDAMRANPASTDARRCRAILLARRGNLAQAGQDINLCLEKEPRSGITLYAAACVCAHVVRKHSTAAAKAQALDFLRRAFACGYGLDKAAVDPDFASIRQDADFKSLLRITRQQLQ